MARCVAVCRTVAAVFKPAAGFAAVTVIGFFPLQNMLRPCRVSPMASSYGNQVRIAVRQCLYRILPIPDIAYADDWYPDMLFYLPCRIEFAVHRKISRHVVIIMHTRGYAYDICPMLFQDLSGLHQRSDGRTAQADRYQKGRAARFFDSFYDFPDISQALFQRTAISIRPVTGFYYLIEKIAVCSM